ncbi:MULTISPECIES: 4-hydroxyphenylacetate 3-hydroxylase N-terminal domain-containing protein [Microbacterium]|uniref:Pyoverdin chromophore biosynthetic protein pvcC n=1 Tax=Microbacterium wangchenii TaxID=2541726 RepID=A0ABX5SYI7_9MICO|nr:MULTISPECIES: 4-hydroxyphenylacetate 3-hydroxylase N-terminal domain-containing protein [Microbacterium]MCK6066021.1 Pyoverdin chromophore biosynthetic protein pvcC [Microbacterium sp. EYE_512]QBR90310.1 Pyoverdin chromophore biosynthetic protein pvcC [Microbacterium wangchenii]
MVEFAESRPQTGADYLDSLRDERVVWLRGDRVADVTAHPAFAQTARTVAGLYDALHDGSTPLLPTDTGRGGQTHPFFLAARSPEHLVASRNAIRAWARRTYGWMGRTPDYKAAFLGSLGATQDWYGEYAPNAQRWYRHAQEHVSFFGHAIVDPPVDRHLPPDEIGDIAVHAVRETDAGVVVSGAKVVATGAVGAQFALIAPTGAALRDPAFAIVAVVPISAPGVTLLARTSYAEAASATGSPFDYPLTSRFDENDAILVLDRVLIPWEDLLVYRDLDRARSFTGVAGFPSRLALHGATRLGVKFDFLAGLLLKALEATGTGDFRGVRTRVGEVLAWRSMVNALTDAMVLDPRRGEDGTWSPQADAVDAYRWLSTIAYPRVREIVLQDLGSALIYLPSHASDFDVPELAPSLRRYLRGSEGVTAEARVKTMKMLWDAVGTEFAGRHDLYERTFQGNHEGLRLVVYGDHESSGRSDRLRAFAEEALGDYDRGGWLPGGAGQMP